MKGAKYFTIQWTMGYVRDMGAYHGNLNFCGPQRSCGKIIFSQACVKNSVHVGGCLPQCMLGYTHTPWADTTPGRHRPGQTPLPSACWDTHTHPPLPSVCWDTHTPTQCMLGYTPCPVHAGIDMATAADGTHPTGMHSCSTMNTLSRNFPLEKFLENFSL